MVLENVLHMNAGDEESSYAKNSSIQKSLLLNSRKVLEDSINDYGIDGFPQCFKLADLVCSSGPNTLLLVNNIIDIVHANMPKQRLADEKEDTCKDQCFISGVPGSFYTRLFPTRSFDFFHSSSSVHWLSQVPEKLENNKGHIHLTEESPPAESLHDMSSKGFLNEADIDSFNIPFYNPTTDEVKGIIDTEGSFSLESLQTFKHGAEIQSSSNKCYSQNSGFA
ncbi:hypothetical protein POM88_026125 [Heracleum sosnowskyi]|uniref:Uncharacterized protein n=1 Tax=Heracleum sosnowskyi TaxID=360622 RepID=A0AAD8MN79_9APIA|nr:hypothetical protein POM88_026125 [Heracleum sosnowskyi]